MAYGIGFQTYLQGLQQETQMKAQAFAQEQMLKKQLANQITATIGQIGDRVKKNKQELGMYQNAFMESDYSKQMPDVPTEEEQALSMRKQELENARNQIQAGTQKTISGANTMRGIEKTDRAIIDYQMKLEDLNRQLSEVETSLQAEKTRPDYMIRKENAKFNEFLKMAPLGSGQYYDVLGQSKTDKMDEWMQKEQFKSQLRIMESRVKAGDRNAERILTNVKMLMQKYSEVQNDVNIADENQRYEILNSLRSQIEEVLNTPGVSEVDRNTGKALLPAQPVKPEDKPVKVKKEGFFARRKRLKEEENLRKAEIQKQLIEALKVKSGAK